MSHYLTEFPDYDAQLPMINGFVDDSWHNDTCPSLFNAVHNLKLWCEYASPALRNGAKRFILYYQDIEESTNDLLILESDSLDDIKDIIKKWTTQ
jgi:hypothetical protein